MRSVNVEFCFKYTVHNRTSMQITVAMYKNLVKILDLFNNSEVLSLSSPTVSNTVSDGISSLIIKAVVLYDIKRADLDFELCKLQEKISYETSSYCYSYDIIKRKDNVA